MALAVQIPLGRIADCPREAATIMSTRVRGTLDGQDRADTYALWRAPGHYRFELDVQGDGAVSLLLEARCSDGARSPGSTGGWKVIAERTTARSGLKITGLVTVPEVRINSAAKLGWVELRLRISRTTPAQSVEYEFYLDPGDQGPSPATQRTG
jgi:hypothetical protein